MDGGKTNGTYAMTSLNSFDMIPILGAIITIASIGFKAGKILQKLEHVIESVDKMDKRMTSNEDHIKSIENRAIVL